MNEVLMIRSSALSYAIEFWRGTEVNADAILETAERFFEFLNGTQTVERTGRSWDDLPRI